MIKSKIGRTATKNTSKPPRPPRPLSSNPTTTPSFPLQRNTLHNRTEKENHTTPKDKSHQLTAMKNRISYIERESQKNLTRIQLKQERLAYLRKAKAEADAQQRQLLEAQKAEKAVLLHKKQGVNEVKRRRKTRLSSIKQQLIEDKQEAYRRAKLEKAELKRKREEEEKKVLELKKSKVKRKGSLRRSMVFALNDCNSKVDLFDSNVKNVKSSKKRKKCRDRIVNKEMEEEYGLGNEEFEREVERLERLEREQLDKLAMTVKEKQRIEQNFNELMNYRGEQH